MAEEYTACFDVNDFDRWWLEGRDRTDPIDKRDREELFRNCIYLATVEQRRLLQTESQLRDEIAAWAEAWNERILRASDCAAD